jgi:hypothetical protein
MAKTKKVEYIGGSKHRVTSIGLSKNSRPKNKQQRKSWKKYRGQGR